MRGVNPPGVPPMMGQPGVPPMMGQPPSQGQMPPVRTVSELINLLLRGVRRIEFETFPFVHYNSVVVA